MNKNKMDNKENNKIELISLDIKSLYESRLFLIFLEENPLTNKYRQVLLSPKQYRMILTTLQSIFPTEIKNGFVNGNKFKQSKEVYSLPDLQSKIIQ